MTHSLLDFDKEFIEWTFFVEKIIASALEPTIGMLFTKRMIVVALMISLFPSTSTGHKWSSMKVLYSNYTEYRPKKITPLKKQILSILVIMTTCQVTCHCTRSTYTPLFKVLVNHYYCQTCKSQQWTVRMSPRFPEQAIHSPAEMPIISSAYI